MSLCRCIRCERLYAPADEQDQCCYHPGQHYRLGWTCCRDPAPGARGCRLGVHLEDAAATAALDDLWMRETVHVKRQDSNASEPAENLDVVVFEDPDGQMNVAQQASSESEEVQAPRSLGPEPPPSSQTTESSRVNPETGSMDVDGGAGDAIGDGGNDESTVLVPYLVGPFDTFSAICMRHQMEPEELMRVNGLRRRYARPGSTVLVWAQRSAGAVHEEMQRTLMMAFRRRCKCPPGEARYYLESNAYDMDRALRCRQEELQWERTAEGQAAAQVRLPPPNDLDGLGSSPVKIRSGSHRGFTGSLVRCLRCVPAGTVNHAPLEL